MVRWYIGIVWYNLVWYGMVWLPGIEQYVMLWHSIVSWYGMLWYCTAWLAHRVCYDMVWYNLVWLTGMAENGANTELMSSFVPHPTKSIQCCSLTQARANSRPYLPL